MITFSSCFYILKSKFDPKNYIYWMNNFISIVKHFNLVIYTDQNAIKYINIKGNPRIKIVLKPMETFHQFKKKTDWIKNHDKKINLHQVVDWEVNMLWNEKIWFVKETIEKKYFETEFYGWCDIGYFRNRSEILKDLNTFFLNNWCNSSNTTLINLLKNNINKIIYGCVNNDENFIHYLKQIINNKLENGLPITPIPSFQNSIAGGFFLLHKYKITWFQNIYDSLLTKYFENNYLIKDDQIILANIIFDNQLNNNFLLFKEDDIRYDNWFMFQRILN